LVTITTASAITPASASPLTASRKRSGESSAAATSAITIAPSEYLNDAASPTLAPPASSALRDPVRSTTAAAHSASAHGRIPGPSLSASRE
jgi:hypothetical protein